MDSVILENLTTRLALICTTKYLNESCLYSQCNITIFYMKLLNLE